MEWMEKNPALYNQASASWKGKEVKADPTAAQADKMNYSNNLLDKWMTSFWNVYVKLTREKSGQAIELMTERHQWIVNNGIFMKSYIKRAHSTTLKISGNSDNSSDDGNVSDESQTGVGSQFLDDTTFQQRLKEKGSLQ